MKKKILLIISILLLVLTILLSILNIYNYIKKDDKFYTLYDTNISGINIIGKRNLEYKKLSSLFTSKEVTKYINITILKK